MSIAASLLALFDRRRDDLREDLLDTKAEIVRLRIVCKAQSSLLATLGERRDGARAEIQRLHALCLAQDAEIKRLRAEAGVMVIVQPEPLP